MNTIKEKQWISAARYVKSTGNKGSSIFRIIGFLTSTRIFLAFNGMLVYLFSSYLYGIKPDPLLLESAFLVTLAVYTLNMVTDRSEDTLNQDISFKNEQLLGISIFSIIASLGICSIIGVKAFIIIMIPLIAGVLYSVKVTSSAPRLKEVLGAKSLIVALTWAFTGSLLPFVTKDIKFNNFVMMFLYIFIQLFVNTVLFDLLDMEGDLKVGITTIPIHIGRDNTKKLLLGINSLLIPWFLYAFTYGVFKNYIIPLGFGTLYSYLLIIYFCSNKRNRVMHELFIDGEWIPQVTLLLTLTHIL